MSPRIEPLIAACMLALGSAAVAADAPPAWLAGCWQGETDTAAAQAFEVWSAPRADRMLGMSQTLRSGGSMFEFMRIEGGARGLRFVAQPGGRPPTEFAAERVEAQRIVFANAKNDFPKSIDYRRIGDRLEARLGATPPDQDGKRVLYAFRRVACDDILAAR
ncbi:MAG: DUF6265 family protein [Burkholderiaceae bacterium]